MKLIKVLWRSLYLWAFTRDVEKHGVTVPVILSRDGYIVDGSTRIEAARRLGIKQIPAIVLDSDVQMVSVNKAFLSHNIHQIKESTD